MKKYRIFIIGWLLVFISPSLWANPLYLAQEATGNGSGGDDLNRASVATHNAGTGLFGDLAGVTIFLKGEITSAVVPPKSGTPDNYIIYDGLEEGDSTPGVTPTAAIHRSGGNNQVAFDIDESFIIVRDLEITGTHVGVRIGDSDAGVNDVKILSCYLHSFWQPTDPDPQSGNKGIVVKRSHQVSIGGEGNGNLIDGCGYGDTGDGDIIISGRSHDVYVGYNILRGSKSEQTGTDGITVLGSEKILIEYNDIYDHASTGNAGGYGGEDGIDLKGTLGDFIIRFNHIHGYHKEGTIKLNDNNTSSGVTECSGNYYIYGNRLTDSYYGVSSYSLEATGNAYYWSNLIINNTRAGFRNHSDFVGQAYFHNNTIVENGVNTQGYTRDPQDDTAGICVRAGSAEMRNNILYNNQSASTDYQIYDTRGSTIENNAGFEIGATAHAYSGGSDMDFDQAGSGNIIQDPLLGNGHTLGDESTLIDGAEDLSGLIAIVTIQGVEHSMYWEDALLPSTDWSTSPPTVHAGKQTDYGGFEPGAYISLPASQSCVELGGTCCEAAQFCSGTSSEASDCQNCCLTGSCQNPSCELFDAENMDLLPPMIIVSEAGAQSGGLIEVSGGSNSSDPAAEATAEVDIRQPGLHYLWLRMRGPDDQSDALYAGIDGSWDRLYPSHAGQWDWVRVETSNGSGDYDFDLSEGSHLVQIGHGEAGAQLDGFLLTNQPGYHPDEGACPLICLGPWRDCNGELEDGCEANVQSSSAHCGECGQPCPEPGVCSGGSCIQDECDPATCPSGFCADGVCCESECSGVCQACVQAKTGEADGLCRDVFDGSDCDDGDPCTTQDQCTAGICVGQPSADCEENDPDEGGCNCRSSGGSSLIFILFLLLGRRRNRSGRTGNRQFPQMPSEPV